MTTSPLANPTATRELLEEFGLATKHRLGQNFLVDNHVIERICELAELAGDERVLEVGPGVGTLTLALLQEAACVTSIEADPELEPVLDAHAADYANFRFIMGDALKVGPEQIEHVHGGLIRRPPVILNTGFCGSSLMNPVTDQRPLHTGKTPRTVCQLPHGVPVQRKFVGRVK